MTNYDNLPHADIPFTADQVAAYVLFENATILSLLGTEALKIGEAVGGIFEALLEYVPEDASVAFPIDMSIYRRLAAAADKGFFEALEYADELFGDEEGKEFTGLDAIVNGFQESLAEEADALDEVEFTGLDSIVNQKNHDGPDAS